MPYFLFLITLMAFGGVAGSGEERPVYLCRPTLSYFCSNIHVSCSGATSIGTTPFSVAVAGAVASVAFDGLQTPVSGIVHRNGDLVVRLQHSRDWIRIEPDGRYSHRVYRRRGAFMSRGTCAPAPAG